MLNTAKVYMVVQDFNSDSSGEGTLVISPSLQTSPADTEAIKVESVEMTVAATNDIVEVGISPPLLYNYNLSVIEDPL